MGNYSILYIGSEETFYFKWSFGEYAWRELSLIFKKTDYSHGRTMLGTHNRHWEGYRTTAREALGRLDDCHLTIGNMDKTISKILHIPKKNVKIAAIPGELVDDEAITDEELSVWEDIQEKQAFRSVGEYPHVRYLRGKLEHVAGDTKVILDLSEILDMFSKSEQRQELERFERIFESEKIVDRDYLQDAKIFFVDGDYDLVYMYLIIALESHIWKFYKHVEKRRKLRGDVFRALLEKTKLMNKLKLVNLFKRDKISELDILNISKIYEKRNSIVHYSSKKFDRSNIPNDIATMERVCGKLAK